MKRFYSIEYMDDEDEYVIRHASMTKSEAEELLEEFSSRGVTATIHDLTPESVDAAVAVTSENGEYQRLEAAPRGRLE